jgi:Fe-S-cluster containining protein
MSFSRKFRLRELRRVLDRIRSQGFAPQAFDPLEAAAVTMFADEIIGVRPGHGTSTRLAGALAALQDRANAVGRSHITEIECRRGCDHCCKIFASTTATQVFAIADYIRANQMVPSLAIDRLSRLEGATRGVDLDGRIGTQIPCPFLDGHACSIYPARPTACRGFMSASAEACRIAVSMKGAPDIDQPVFAIAYRGVVDQALFAVLHQRGLSNSSYELGEAVMRVLSDTNAEKRWFAGEDVFAGVQMDNEASVIMPAEQAAKSWRVLFAIASGEPVARDWPFAHVLPRWCFD